MLETMVYNVETMSVGSRGFKVLHTLSSAPILACITSDHVLNQETVLIHRTVSFISYFESTWVRTSTTSPLFSHNMWDQHDASLMLIPRSSKIAEGWHHGSHSMLSCSNPTLWKFLDALKSEQALMQTRSCHGESSINYQSHHVDKLVCGLYSERTI